MSIEAACSEITSIELDRCYLIGIDGFGGSGKTTTAKKLGQLLGSTRIVHMDDHITDKSANNTPDLLGFDRVGLVNELLVPIINKKMLPDEKYLIIEGISALHPDFRDFLDYRIWINTSIDESKRRAVARDVGRGNEHLRDMWVKNDLNYYYTHAPQDAANIIVV